MLTTCNVEGEKKCCSVRQCMTCNIVDELHRHTLSAADFYEVKVQITWTGGGT